MRWCDFIWHILSATLSINQIRGSSAWSRSWNGKAYTLSKSSIFHSNSNLLGILRCFFFFFQSKERNNVIYLRSSFQVNCWYIMCNVMSVDSVVHSCLKKEKNLFFLIFLIHYVWMYDVDFFFFCCGRNLNRHVFFFISLTIQYFFFLFFYFLFFFPVYYLVSSLFHLKS